MLMIRHVSSLNLFSPIKFGCTPPEAQFGMGGYGFEISRRHRLVVVCANMNTPRAEHERYSSGPGFMGFHTGDRDFS